MTLPSPASQADSPEVHEVLAAVAQHAEIVHESSWGWPLIGAMLGACVCVWKRESLAQLCSKPQDTSLRQGGAAAVKEHEATGLVAGFDAADVDDVHLDEDHYDSDEELLRMENEIRGCN
jgi:hypothetical protein